LIRYSLAAHGFAGGLICLFSFSLRYHFAFVVFYFISSLFNRCVWRGRGKKFSLVMRTSLLVGWWIIPSLGTCVVFGFDVGCFSFVLNEFPLSSTKKEKRKQ